MLRRRDEQAGGELIRAGLRKEGIDVGFGHQAFGVVELALDGAQLARLPLTGHEVDATVRSSAPAAARTRCLYPRARGADAGRLHAHGLLEPLPPRTRGRHDIPVPCVPRDASTPAHAGPTPGPRCCGAWACLYPRARGAGGLIGRGSGQPRPLPPRTRGRRAAGDGQAGHAASTPAHAGPAPESHPRAPARHLGCVS